MARRGLSRRAVASNRFTARMNAPGRPPSYSRRLSAPKRRTSVRMTVFIGQAGDGVRGVLHSNVTARTPTRAGSIPTQPSNGGSPVSPDVSLTIRLNTAIPAPRAKMRRREAARPPPAGLHCPDGQSPADGAERSENGQIDQPGHRGGVDARLRVGRVASRRCLVSTLPVARSMNGTMAATTVSPRPAYIAPMADC